MHTLSEYLKALMIAFVFSSVIFAQLPDPYDPLYDFNDQILKAGQAKDLHVLSCKVFKDGKYLKKVVFNGNGHEIEDDKGKYLFEYKKEEFSIKHDMGRIWHMEEYDPEYHKIATATYFYNNNRTVSRIMWDYELSKSEKMVEFAYYQDGPLGITMIQSYDQKENELIQTKTELFYNEQKQLDAYKRTKTVSFASSQILKYTFIEICRYKNGRPDVLETRHQNTDGSTVDKNYQYIYDDAGHLSKTQLIRDSGNNKDIEFFSYYENGLLKSHKTEYGEYTFDYEFMKTARLNIEIKDDITRPKFHQYHFDYANRVLEDSPNSWHLDIYMAGLEIFILELSEYDHYPIFLEPGKTVNVIYANGEFEKISNDPVNDLVWEIENNISNISYYIDDEEYPEEAWNAMKEMIDEQMHQNESSPAFIYYSSVFDMSYVENDAFDDISDMLVGPEDRSEFLKKYSEHMIRQYPYNPTLIKQYAGIKK